MVDRVKSVCDYFLRLNGVLVPQLSPDAKGNLRTTLYKLFPDNPTKTALGRHPGRTVAMSMEAVASSMMKMLVFLTKARARQNSCLWPWLKFSPPSVMMASEKRVQG